MTPEADSVGDGDLLRRLMLLTHGLNVAGVPAALAEAIDAAVALGHLDLLDRTVVRAGLRATLVKRSDDLATFDALFDRYFPLTRAVLRAQGAEPTRRNDGAPGVDEDNNSPTPGSGDAGAGTGSDTGAGGSTDLLEALLAALRAGDLDALRAIAGALVDAHGGLGEGGDGAPVSERYHLYRVLRAADISRLLADAARILRGENDHDDALAARLRDREQQQLVEDFRRLIADEIRGRLAGALGPAEIVRSTRIDELEVLRASTTELRALRDAVRPLARKLATRMAQRRRLKRRGKLDVRRTVRRSLQSGGVPMLPALRDRRASKPDVVVLCDVSGSVAEFANFTLQLLSALHDELARLRSFVFVDGISEVTELLASSEHAIDPRFLVSRPGVVVGDGHSDYAMVFERFVMHHGDALRPSTTVIIAGDARTNYRPAGEATLGDVAARVKQVLWFNPEPSAEWNAGDSRVAAYRPHCKAFYEVRTLRQLADAVSQLV